MQKQRGFTVVEVLIVITFLLVGSWVFFSQKATADAVIRDQQRKTAINAMYYSLEEVYYEQKGYYPTTIDSKVLRSVDPDLFTDPDGYKLGEPESDYRYEGSNCGTDTTCASYRLSSHMEEEEEYEKTSRRDEIRK